MASAAWYRSKQKWQRGPPARWLVSAAAPVASVSVDPAAGTTAAPPAAEPPAAGPLAAEPLVAAAAASTWQLLVAGRTAVAAGPSASAAESSARSACTAGRSSAGPMLPSGGAASSGCQPGSVIRLRRESDHCKKKML